MLNFRKILLLAATLMTFSANTNAASIKPTFILVHGALLDSTIWAPVQNYLQNHHYNVVTVDVPGRNEDGIAPKDVTLDMAAKKVCDIAALQTSPVILVGHSQAGAVITQADGMCKSRIQSLVYVAAVMPKNGESVFQLLNEQDGMNFDQCATADKKSGLYQINKNGPLKEMFMAEATPEQAARAIANLTPEPLRIGDDVLHYNENDFNAVPKFYITTTEDRIISPETQSKYMQRAKLQKIYEIHSSHSPFLTHAQELGKYLAEIAASNSA